MAKYLKQATAVYAGNLSLISLSFFARTTRSRGASTPSNGCGHSRTASAYSFLNEASPS